MRKLDDCRNFFMGAGGDCSLHIRKMDLNWNINARAEFNYLATERVAHEIRVFSHRIWLKRAGRFSAESCT